MELTILTDVWSSIRLTQNGGARSEAEQNQDRCDLLAIMLQLPRDWPEQRGASNRRGYFTRSGVCTLGHRQAYQAMRRLSKISTVENVI